MISEQGVRSGAVYDISTQLRRLLFELGKPVILRVDLKPMYTVESLAAKIAPYLLGSESAIAAASAAMPRLTRQEQCNQRRHFGRKGLQGSSLAYRLYVAARVPKISIPLLQQRLEAKVLVGWDSGGDALSLARAVKGVELEVTEPWPLASAISSEGGVDFEAIDQEQHWGMLKARAGVFVAGEMLDWNAPCGGYLLTASMSTGDAAAKGILRWLAR